MVKVAVVRCDAYAEKAVAAAVEEGLALLGGAERFARPGEKLLLKPNMLAADPPAKCVTTHPAVFRAVAAALLQAGAAVSFGDSPAIGSPQRVARKCGLLAAAASLGIPLADCQTPREVGFREGFQNRRFVLARGVVESDGLISLSKLKTHGLTRMTGAVKNQFGCVPGALKSEYHVKLPDADAFARMLVDLNRCLRPRLFIMDAVFGMEGNGPRGGRPRKIGCLLFSQDPVALDATACRLIGLNPYHVPTTRVGGELGLGVAAEAEIRVVGAPLASLRAAHFEVDRTPPAPPGDHRLGKLLGAHLVPRPVILPDRCIRCGLCVQFCPARPRALTWDRRHGAAPPVYHYDACIRCFCCQEICPQSAVRLKVPPLRRLYRGLQKLLPAALKMG